MKQLMIVCGLTLAGICLTGCQGSGQETSRAQAQDKAKAKLESFQKIAAQTAQTYKAMDNNALLEKLVEQSKAQKEPFNSLAYRELKGRTNVSSDALVSLVNQMKNGDALLPLLLLRRSNQQAYLAIPAEQRAAVLTDALQKSKTFNTWGLPNVNLEDASRAMLETGRSAYPALTRMLSDTRPAPVFGGQQVSVYKRYKFRLCDYALFFLKRLQGDAEFRLPESPADRDSLIQAMVK